LTVSEVARRYRVSADKVRGWIRRGELAAVNTARHPGGKPRFVITPEALLAFEKKFAATTDPPRQTRRRQSTGARFSFNNADPKAGVDYFPDDPAEEKLVRQYTTSQITREELAKAVRRHQRFQEKNS
jgi:excisionase family DNA binding protein